MEANQRIEERLAEAAQAGASDFRDRSLLEFIEGYHQLQALAYLIKSVEASVEALEAQLQQIEAMVRQQKAADVDRLRVQVRLSDRLLAAQGVAAVDVAGGLEREIRIYLDPVLLEKHELSLAWIEQRLQEENIHRIGGRVTGDNQETIVRTFGEFTDLETIREIVLLRNESGTLRLRDVARVEDSHEEVRMLTRLDGRPAVKVNIIKQADANTVQEWRRSPNMRPRELFPDRRPCAHPLPRGQRPLRSPRARAGAQPG